MNKNAVLVGVICLSMILSLTGCQTVRKTFLPVTGSDSASAPAQVETARNNTIDYLISSARLKNTPPRTGWLLDTSPRKKGVYLYSGGDWVMTVWVADEQGENHRVILRNKVTHAVWCGYVQPNGSVIDTSYLP
jgi:hypothetical protein